MTKSMKVHPRGEVTCQELANPSGHESGGHRLRPSHVRVDYHLLRRLQNRPLDTALLQSDLTLIPSAYGPLEHSPRNEVLPGCRPALLHGRPGGSIRSLVSGNALMAWHPPEVDLMSLSPEGLNSLLGMSDRGAAASPICALEHLNGRLRVRHYGCPLPVPGSSEAGKSPANASELSISTRLERPKGETKGGTAKWTMRVLKDGGRPTVSILH